MNTSPPWSLEEPNNDTNVTPLRSRKALDAQVPEDDWLTPMKSETEFLVRRRGGLDIVFLDCYRKVCNYEHTVFLMEERFGEEVPRYVLPLKFCREFELVEVTFKHE